MESSILTNTATGYEEQSAPTDPLYQQQRRPASPPHASGGYPPVPPPPPAVAPAVAAASIPTVTTTPPQPTPPSPAQLRPNRSSKGFTQLPNINFTDVNQFQTPYPMGSEAMPMPAPGLGPAPVQQQPVQQPAQQPQQQYQQYQPYNPQDYVASYPPPAGPSRPPAVEVPPVLIPGSSAAATAPSPPDASKAPQGVGVPPPQEVPPALRAPQGVPASLMVGAPSHLSQSQSQSVAGNRNGNRPEDVSMNRYLPAIPPAMAMGDDERDGRVKERRRRRSMQMSRSRPRRSRDYGIGDGDSETRRREQGAFY